MSATNKPRFFRIDDGKLNCAVKGNRDLFADTSKNTEKKITTLERKIEAERDLLDKVRRDNILWVFREEVKAFKDVSGNNPSLCLLNYRDVRLLCEAFNGETREKGIERASLSRYDDGDATRFIDQTRIKQGCDQRPGEFRFYSSE